MAENKSIMLYLDTYKQWEMLTDTQAGILIKALFAYASTGEQLRTDDGMVSMAFSFITAQIDRDNEKWAETCRKRAESVRKRWHKDDANASGEIQKIQMYTNDTDTVTDTETDTDTDTDTEKEKENIKESADKPRPARASKRFTPPTVEEVQAYCQERQNGINPQYFVDYYTARGWKIGKVRLTDWQAQIRKWEHDEKQRAPDKSHQPRDSSFDLADFDKLVNRFEGA